MYNWSVKVKVTSGFGASVIMRFLFRVTTWTEKQDGPQAMQFTKFILVPISRFVNKIILDFKVVITGIILMLWFWIGGANP